MPIRGEFRLPVSDKPIHFELVRQIIPNKRGDKVEVVYSSGRRDEYEGDDAKAVLNAIKDRGLKGLLSKDKFDLSNRAGQG
jgi:hypothetical protein